MNKQTNGDVPKQELQGVLDSKGLALALHISDSTLRGLGIPHVRLTRSSRIYFPDEVVAWLRSRERSL